MCSNIPLILAVLVGVVVAIRYLSLVCAIGEAGMHLILHNSPFDALQRIVGVF